MYVCMDVSFRALTEDGNLWEKFEITFLSSFDDMFWAIFTQAVWTWKRDYGMWRAMQTGRTN
jgi:hypothetical protein